jgi:penicillin-binding protein 1A
MVAAYSTFATLGNRSSPQAIIRVEDNKGGLLWEPEPVRVPVMSIEEAWLMVSVMKDVVQRGTAAGSVGSVFHYPAGGKTGTTNDGTDVWFIGYTSDLVAGVWMGFDKPQKIKSNAQGGLLAAPAWSAFMTEAYRRKPAPRDWPTPPGIIARQIDFSTNLLATTYCPRDLVGSEFFIPGTDPIRECDVHLGVLVPDTSGYGATPYPPIPNGGNPPRVDTGPPPVTGGAVPGAANMPRVTRPSRDTTRRATDTALFNPPPGDTTRRRPPPRDSIRRRDTTRVPPKPDTSIVRQ